MVAHAMSAVYPVAMNRTILAALSIAALMLTASTTPVHARPDQPGVVRLRVEDKSLRTDAKPIHLASSLNNWNPGDDAWKLEAAKNTDGTSPANTWEARIDLSKIPSDAESIEFKFARGNWDTVEVDADGGDVGNRSINVKLLRSRSGTVMTLEPIQGFADQRGGRWPNMSPPGAPRKSTVVGTVDTFDFTSTILKNTRKVRVWTPPGYTDAVNAGKHYPVLYMHDGQNCFDVVGSFAGYEWECDEAATALIKLGQIDPLIIVAMDNTGGTRAEEYNPPYTHYLDKQNRGDEYLKFVIDEVMPMIDSKYRTLKGPENTGIGGSSFGGNATLYAVMERPDIFGRAIVESAAVFLDNSAIVKKVREHDKWPIRMFVAVGTAETARSGDAKAFADLNREMMDALRAKGLGEDRLMTQVEEGAKHFESAWAKRFPTALKFVFGR